MDRDLSNEVERLVDELSGAGSYKRMLKEEAANWKNALPTHHDFLRRQGFFSEVE